MPANCPLALKRISPMTRTVLTRFTPRRFPAGLFVALAFCAGCAAWEQPFQDRIARQDALIARLREDNAKFQANYYQIKELLDSQTSDTNQRLIALQRELDQSRNLKSRRERELEDELNLVRLQFDAYQAESTERQRVTDSRLTRLHKELRETSDGRDEALGRLADLENRLDAQQERADLLEGQLDEQRRSAETLAAEATRLRSELEEARAAADDAARLRDTLGAREESLSELEAENESLSRSLQEERDRRARAQSALEEAAAGRDQAMEEVAEADRRLETLREELASGASAREELAAAAEQLGRLETRLDRLGEENESLEARVSELQSQLESALQRIPTPPGEDAELVRAAGRLRQGMEGIEPTGAVRVRLDGRGLRVILPAGLLFDPGSTLLAERAGPVLDRIGDLVGGLDGRPIRIEGHTGDRTDPDLPFADNWGLGFSRADRVREYLLRTGRVGGDRVMTLTRAHHDPLDETPHRVEIVVGAREP